MEGALVEWAARSPMSARTDSLGRYVFATSSLGSPGRYSEGYVNICASEGDRQSIRAMIRSEGFPEELPDLVLHRTGKFVVRVLDPEGKPVQGASVTLSLSSGLGADCQRGQSDVRGEYVYGPVADVPYDVFLVVNWEGAVPFETYERHRPQELACRLSAPRTVRGRLLDHQGMPAEGFGVAFSLPPWGTEPVEAWVDGCGCFELARVPMRDATLAVLAPGSTDVAHSVTFWKVPDEQSELGDYRIGELGTLSLRVRTATGEAWSGTIRWFGESGVGGICPLDPPGDLRLDFVPRHQNLRLWFEKGIPSKRYITERLELPALPDETVEWTMTGRDTIILRLVQDGERIRVPSAEAYWEGGSGGTLPDGSTDEIRVRRDGEGDLFVKIPDQRPIRVPVPNRAAEGPTYIDVTIPG
ncbi:MAG: hypothetical protein AAGD14_01375 [Planctomycetota bacterium]